MNKQEQHEYFVNLGKQGGKATAKKHGKEHYEKIGKKGHKALMAKLKSL